MKKKVYQKKPFESDQSSQDTSANIYMSMLLSENWKRLTKNAQVLYLYCKAQYYAERKKPIPQHAKLTDEELSRCFTMNKCKWCESYGLYTNQKQFYVDMELLIENGFVELVESGKITRTKNIYMLSEKWNKKM